MKTKVLNQETVTKTQGTMDYQMDTQKESFSFDKAMNLEENV